MGIRPEVQIIPFRGEYYMLQARSAAPSCAGSIYPVPDPRFPFLGVHFTRTVHGDVEAGSQCGAAPWRARATRWAR